MSIDPNRIITATKAAFPELWESGSDVHDDALKGMEASALATARQNALSRVGQAIAAYDENVGGDPTPAIMLVLPEDAAMLEQALVTLTYFDKDGKLSYSVQTMGDGVLSTWLGMGVLAQNYLLRQLTENGTETS
jgi:hypothetical protein